MTNFRTLRRGPLEDTGNVSKPLLCCLSLLGSMSCWKVKPSALLEVLKGLDQIFIKYFTPYRPENLKDCLSRYYEVATG